MSRFLIKLFVLLALLGLFGAAGCGGGGLPARQAGGPQEQGQEQAREQAPAPPGSSRTAEPGIGTGKTKGPDPRPFVHQFMSCRLLEPFGQQAYAMLTERGRQAFINGSDPTLGGTPVMQRMTGYRLEDIVEGQNSWTATVSVWLTGPADKAESMFYREKLTVVRRGKEFAVDGWEAGSPTQAYAAQRWTNLCARDAAGKEHVIITSGQIPVPFTPQGDNPQQKITSAGEFKCVALFPDGRAAFATLGLFGSAVGVAAGEREAQVLAQYESGVNELVWAPGGRLLAVEVRMPSGKTDIAIYDVAANRPVLSVSEVIPEKGGNLTRGCWLADDRYFYLFSAAAEGPQKLWMLDLEGRRAQPAEL